VTGSAAGQTLPRPQALVRDETLRGRGLRSTCVVMWHLPRIPSSGVEHPTSYGPPAPLNLFFRHKPATSEPGHHGSRQRLPALSLSHTKLDDRLSWHEHRDRRAEAATSVPPGRCRPWPRRRHRVAERPELAKAGVSPKGSGRIGIELARDRRPGERGEQIPVKTMVPGPRAAVSTASSSDQRDVHMH
jgi:hypothetical protein